MIRHKNEIGSYVEKDDLHYGDHVNKRGWGRGYVTIPFGHPFTIKFMLDLWQEDGYKGIPIDYWQPSQVADGMFTIGFNTKEGHNMTEHGEQYVRDTTQKLMNWVFLYTWQDARNEVREHVKQLKRQYESDKLDAWDYYKQIKDYEE